MQRFRQIKETEKYIPNEQDKITTTDLNEMKICNMPDMEFKVIMINILIGLEKRVEDS